MRGKKMTDANSTIKELPVYEFFESVFDKSIVLCREDEANVKAFWVAGGQQRIVFGLANNLVYCDKCGKELDDANHELAEAVRLDYIGSSHSVFGTGCRVRFTLCQHCLKSTFEDIIHVSGTPAEKQSDALDWLVAHGELVSFFLCRVGPEQHAAPLAGAIPGDLPGAKAQIGVGDLIGFMLLNAGQDQPSAGCADDVRCALDEQSGVYVGTYQFIGSVGDALCDVVLEQMHGGDPVEIQILLGVVQAERVKIKGVNLLTAEFFGSDRQDAGASSCIQHVGWSFASKNPVELFQAKSSCEVIAGSEAESGFQADRQTVRCRCGFPFRHHLQACAEGSCFEVQFPEISPVALAATAQGGWKRWIA
eukprot:TRINITY_DN28809_c0_g1_i1.p1 TRINITY_DN28809_c0_g1~~TRINITY_DN28809_c0_g1_i1.p1  ORF type:complete len:364 (-),score=37.75 TRINITY_DN28809_c0_g1_i1:104-1195(-)